MLWMHPVFFCIMLRKEKNDRRCFMDKYIDSFSVIANTLANQFDESYEKKDISAIEQLIDSAKQ